MKLLASPRVQSLAILVCLGLVLLAGSHVALKHLVYPAFETYEHELAAKEVSRVEQAIDAQMDLLQIMNTEYSEWDGMYKYVLDPESMPDFIEEEIGPGYWWPIGVELLLILDQSGELQWGMLTEVGGTNKLTLEEIVLPMFTSNPLLTSDAAIHSQVRGLVDTPAGLMMIASAPIVHEDGSGPVAGSFIVGRTFSDTHVAAIAKSTDAKVSLLFLADPMLTEWVREVAVELDAAGTEFLIRSSGGQQYVLSQLHDLYGDPAAVVQISIDRGSRPSAAEAINTALKIIALAIACFVLIAWWLISIWRER